MLRKPLITLTSLVMVIGLYLLVATLWDMSLPIPGSPHDASSSYTVKWWINGSPYVEGNSYDIGNGTYTYDIAIYDSSNSNVTTDFSIGHAFLTAATAQSNTITIYSDYPGSNGEHGQFVLQNQSGARLWAIACKASTGDYVVEWVHLYDSTP